MKRFSCMAAVTAGLVVALGMVGCEKQEYKPKADARIDGVLPHQAAEDLTVFDNHAELHKKLFASTPAPPPVPATAATTTAPAESTTAPAGGSTTAPSDAPPN